MRSSRGMKVAAAVLVVAALAAGCSDDDGGSADGSDPATTTTTTADASSFEVRTPDGPAATIGGPLEGGKGVYLVSAGPGPSLDDAGYTESEYSASGTATSYQADTLPTDGTFALTPRDEADYSTRILVRRPADEADFNGTVVVEWLNVSSGADTAADYTYLADEVLRRGYAWVGVSAQHIGVEGGPIAVQVPNAEGRGLGVGIRNLDPERYGDLHHPGDAYSYDIYTQIGQALRNPGDIDPLDGLQVERLLAIGESQSAFALTTYVNGVQPLTGEFDGFLIHSRGGASAPLGEPDAGIEIASTIGGQPTTIRTDGDAPVMVVQTETDVVGVLGYLPARQPDSDLLRLWEVAGTAHADAFQVGEANQGMLGCTTPINNGQQVFVLRTALRDLDTWVTDGTAPPEAPRLAVDESATPPKLVLDANGNATGGIRTPVVDAPVDVLSGLAPADASIICLLSGSTVPIPDAQLATLYPSRSDYVAMYDAATDDAIHAGFALEDDRDQIIDFSQPDRVAG